MQNEFTPKDILNKVLDKATNKMKVSGDVTLTGSNVTDGVGILEATFEKDPNGNGVLRIVDAAPAAYDETLDSYNTHSSQDLRGLSTNKPLATDVEVGTTYWSVDTDPHANAIEVSNGMEWVVI